VNNGILAGTDPELNYANTENYFEMKKEGEKRQLHRMAKVHNILEMWQGSYNLHATQKECRAQNKQITAMGYISDTQDCLNWNGDLEDPNDSEDHCAADVESDTSAKCNSVRNPYATLSATPVALASAPKYFQMLQAPPGALKDALRLCNSILTCS
jgi:hypothetical protein